MKNRATQIADLREQINGLAEVVAAAERAVVNDALGRLMAALRAALPDIDNTRRVPSPEHSHGIITVGDRVNHTERLTALAGRLAAGTETDDDCAVLAALDAGDLALIGHTSASTYVQWLAEILGRF